MTQRILSISGLRGVVGDGLEPEFIARFATALGTLFQGGTVIVSRDGRGSGLMVKQAVLAGLTASGCRVLDMGIAATPTCGVMITELAAAGGVQITASHNPIQWNGLKPFSQEGSVFDEAAGHRLLDLLESGDFDLVDGPNVGEVSAYDNAGEVHLQRILPLVNADAIRNRGFRVVLDCNHGAGSVLGPRMLETLGCDVHVLGGEPDGRFAHEPEPLAQNLVSLCDEVKRVGADVGFAQDPDADRLAIVDERGRCIGEELTLALCADYVLERTPGPVVVNGSTSRTTADIAAKHGCAFHRSFVGEAHVAAKMHEVGAVLGGEGNGGVIEPRVGYVRDSFVGMAYALAGIAESERPFSAWVDSLPQYTIVKDKLRCDRDRVEAACTALQREFPDATPVAGDGLRLDWEDRWVQVRASNTEPILRIIAEAPDAAAAQSLCTRAVEVVKNAAD